MKEWLDAGAAGYAPSVSVRAATPRAMKSSRDEFARAGRPMAMRAFATALFVAALLEGSAAANKTLLALGARATLATPPKHVLAVVIDDLGADDLGFRNQHQIDTPNFNRLHAAGIDLTSYYVQPSCSPTRAAILTGRKPLHTGINYWLPNIAAGLGLEEVTLAQVLNRRNFVSHAVGKWCVRAPHTCARGALKSISRVPIDHTSTPLTDAGTWASTRRRTRPLSAASPPFTATTRARRTVCHRLPNRTPCRSPPRPH